jgi:hypothetical protein
VHAVVVSMVMNPDNRIVNAIAVNFFISMPDYLYNY